MKKYAPRKVFILENGEYIEITYEEFCRREESDPSYKDKLFLPLYGMLMEVSKATYTEFYRMQRRQKYIDERSKDNKDISYDSLTTDEFNGEDILVDESVDVAGLAIHNVLLDKLRSVIPMLNADEKELIKALFFIGLTEREYAGMCGVSQVAIHKRKNRILAKLKNFLEN